MKKLFWFLAGLTAFEFVLRVLKKRGLHNGHGTIIRTPKDVPLQPTVSFVSKKISTKHVTHSWKRFLKNEPTAAVLIGLALIMILFQGGMQKFSTYFQTSLIEWEYQTEPFNGTVGPIEKVPNWIELSDAERTMNFAQIPESKKIMIPEYDLAAMKAGMVWRRDNEMERNTYITYPVPNLGNYQLDATENSGSHTGLDIKTPIGTPVRSISRGTVIKSESQPTGFGDFIVIMHTEVPDSEHPGQKIKLFSVYAHLSTRDVRPGDIVEKGEIIGKTGMSGMATAPHLHFQIDREDAPFHPYWPFTWKDLQATSIRSYFEAVKYGVNFDQAKQYTIHPMNLVVQNQNYELENLIVSADPTFIPTNEDPDTDPITNIETTVDPDGDVITASGKDYEEVGIDEAVADPDGDTLQNNDTNANVVNPTRRYTDYTSSNGRRIRLQEGEEILVETDRTFRPGTPEVFDVIIADDSLVASAGIEIGTTLRDSVEVYPTVLTKNDFNNGMAQVSVTTNSSSPFKLIATGTFGEVRSKSLRAQIFNDVATSHKNESAIKFVQEKKIMNGYGDGSFQPDGQLNRAEAVKILITANELSLLPAESNFSDVDISAWYSPYVATALARGLVKGYGNGQFKPGNTISRAEFLKIAIEAAGVDVPLLFSQPYPDVNMDAWFAPYLAISAQHNLLSPVRGGNIAPHQTITRAEAAHIIWKLLQIKK